MINLRETVLLQTLFSASSIFCCYVTNIWPYTTVSTVVHLTQDMWPTCNLRHNNKHLRYKKYREMTLVMVGEMSEKIIRGNQLQDCVAKKLQRLIVTTVNDNKQQLTFIFFSSWQICYISLCMLCCLHTSLSTSSIS